MRGRSSRICGAVLARNFADGRSSAYLCISAAELVTPRHDTTIRARRPTARRNRVLKTKAIIDREGGKFALADFQLTPPLGRSMTKRPSQSEGWESKRKLDVLIVTEYEYTVVQKSVEIGGQVERREDWGERATV